MKEAIEQLMLLTGMNARGLAKAMNISHQSIYNWLDETFKPSRLAREHFTREAKKIKRRLEKQGKT